MKAIENVGKSWFSWESVGRGEGKSRFLRRFHSLWFPQLIESVGVLVGRRGNRGWVGPTVGIERQPEAT